ncbi:MAG: hypothetical protein ABIH04_03065 [Planctomycetota bacterium]
MPIKFNCPKCGKKLSVPDSFAGRKARCPGCNEAVGVPASSQENEIPKYDKAQIIGDKAPFSEAIAPLLAKLDLAKIGRVAFIVGFMILGLGVFAWVPLGITGAVVLALGLILLILKGDEREKTAAMIVVGLMIVAMLLILYFELKASRF